MTDRLKICFLSDPVYVHTQRWATFFAHRGHEVTILGGQDGPELPRIRKFSLGEEHFRGPWIWRTTRALRRLLKELKPDVLHMHFLQALVAPVLLRSRPFVVSVWGADIVGETGLAKDPRRIRMLKRYVLRKADVVIALSQFLQRATCEYAGLSPERVLTRYWGVDLKSFAPRAKQPGQEVVIGFVKHLSPKYGPEYLLRAIPLVRARYPRVKVLLVGKGVLREELEHLARDLGIAEVVTFCGSVPHERVPEYVSQMDIMAMPSVYESETFGVAAAEAQAMGVPVVASNVGGIPEAVQDGRTGILVPPRDPAALATALLRLIEDPALRESMSQEGRRFVSENFDWEKNAKKMEELYFCLAAKRP